MAMLTPPVQRPIGSQTSQGHSRASGSMSSSRSSCGWSVSCASVLSESLLSMIEFIPIYGSRGLWGTEAPAIAGGQCPGRQSRSRSWRSLMWPWTRCSTLFHPLRSHCKCRWHAAASFIMAGCPAHAANRWLNGDKLKCAALSCEQPRHSTCRPIAMSWAAWRTAAILRVRGRMSFLATQRPQREISCALPETFRPLPSPFLAIRRTRAPGGWALSLPGQPLPMPSWSPQ